MATRGRQSVPPPSRVPVHAPGQNGSVPSVRTRTVKTVAPPSHSQESLSSSSSDRTAMDVCSAMFQSILEKVVLPAVCDYYERVHGVQSNPQEVAKDALNLQWSFSDHSSNSFGVATPVTKENSTRKPRPIDLVNGCQYLLERSRQRPGQVCGDKRDGTSYFCKQCKKKKAFEKNALAVAERLGLSFEEVAGGDAEYPTESAVKKPAAQRKAPAARSRSQAPVSYPRAPERQPVEQVDQLDETLTIEGDVIDGLEDILQERKSGIVFYYPPDMSEMIAFGQWTEDNKIGRLTEPLRQTALQLDMKIGEYTDFKIGQYSVDYVEGEVGVVDEEEGVEVDEQETVELVEDVAAEEEAEEEPVPAPVPVAPAKNVPAPSRAPLRAPLKPAGVSDHSPVEETVSAPEPEARLHAIPTRRMPLRKMGN